MRGLVFGVVASVCVVGCSKSQPISPGPPPPTVTALAMTPATDWLSLKATQTFAINATMSDGTSRVVTGTWGSDTPGVATAANGQVTGVGAGEAVVFADYEGRRVTRAIRVIPEYAGLWAGTYRDTDCQATVDWVGGCDDLDTQTRWFFQMAFFQNRSSVGGAVVPYSDLAISTWGEVALSGTLTQAGSESIADGDSAMDFTLLDWNTSTPDNLEMFGSFKVSITHRKFQGSLTYTLTLDGVQKVGMTPQRAGGSLAPTRPLRVPLPRHATR